MSKFSFDIKMIMSGDGQTTILGFTGPAREALGYNFEKYLYVDADSQVLVLHTDGLERKLHVDTVISDMEYIEHWYRPARDILKYMNDHRIEMCLSSIRYSLSDDALHPTYIYCTGTQRGLVVTGYSGWVPDELGTKLRALESYVFVQGKRLYLHADNMDLPVFTVGNCFENQKDLDCYLQAARSAYKTMADTGTITYFYIEYFMGVVDKL